MNRWQIANKYHMVHSAALMAIAWSRPLTGAAYYGACGLIAGITLFSGIIYAMCVLPPASPLRKFGMLGPFGGTSFIIGWFLLAYSQIPARL